jgi:YD repeat-containing protein
MFLRPIAAGFAVLLMAFTTRTEGQLATPSPDAVRVTLSMNADGSRTVYEFDAPHHKATATTTSKDGKIVEKIRYTLDDAGRFASGEVYGADEQLRFKTRYKYDATGKLTEEIQFAKDDAVRNKIVYAFDKNGKQTGYSVYDAAGKLIRSTPGLSPGASPASKRR